MLWRKPRIQRIEKYSWLYYNLVYLAPHSLMFNPSWFTPLPPLVYPFTPLVYPLSLLFYPFTPLVLPLFPFLYPFTSLCYAFTPLGLPLTPLVYLIYRLPLYHLLVLWFTSFINLLLYHRLSVLVKPFSLNILTLTHYCDLTARFILPWFTPLFYFP